MKKKTSPLDPEILALLEGFSVKVDRVVEGVLVGLHRSAKYGESKEFAEHKEYTPGDDPRHIDWKVLGRLDKTVIKKYESEKAIKATIGMDFSGSMDYRSGCFSKAEYAGILAASMAKILLRQGDAVGLIARSSKDFIVLPPKRSLEQLAAMVEILEKTNITGSINISELVGKHLENVGKSKLLALFSDLFDPDPQMLRSLKMAATRGSEVLVFHVLDRDEVDFPFEEPSVFCSMEDDRQLMVMPREVRRTYLSEMKRFLDDTRCFLIESGIRYELVLTDEAPHEPLIRQLTKLRKR